MAGSASASASVSVSARSSAPPHEDTSIRAEEPGLLPVLENGAEVGREEEIPFMEKKELKYDEQREVELAEQRKIRLTPSTDEEQGNVRDTKE